MSDNDEKKDKLNPLGDVPSSADFGLTIGNNKRDGVRESEVTQNPDGWDMDPQTTSSTVLEGTEVKLKGNGEYSHVETDMFPAVGANPDNSSIDVSFDRVKVRVEKDGYSARVQEDVYSGVLTGKDRIPASYVDTSEGENKRRGWSMETSKPVQEIIDAGPQERGDMSREK